jgi:hypothetical protein
MQPCLDLASWNATGLRTGGDGCSAVCKPEPEIGHRAVAARARRSFADWYALHRVVTLA